MAYGLPYGAGSTTRFNPYSIYELSGYQPDFDIFQRLLSPDEWDELSPGRKTEFQGYMDYVNQFQQQQKQRRREGISGTIRVPQGGTWLTEGKGIREQAGAGGPSIPKYRTHTDIYGRVMLEPTGGKRTMTGEYIPTSLEEKKTMLQLRTAIPGMEAETAEEIARKQMKAMEARRGLKAEEYLATKTPEELYGLTKTGQAQQRIEQGMQRLEISKGALELRNEQYKSRLTDFDYKERVKQDHRKANIQMLSDLRAASAEQQQKYDMETLTKLGKIPRTKESKDRMIEELEFFQEKAQRNALAAANLEERRFHNRIAEDIQAQIFWVDKQVLEPEKPLETKPVSALQKYKTQLESQYLGVLPKEGEVFEENGVRYKIMNGKKYKWVE